MLKYNDVIIKLSDEQKIRILSGVGRISGKDMKNLGIPCMSVGYMKDMERNLYPHTTSLSHAWNTKLWKEVAQAKTNQMAKEGIDFVIAPGAKIKLSPYRKEMTEDPYLASVISASYIKAATDKGMMTGASGYYITEADAEWMDDLPNERVLHEYVINPYQKAFGIAPSPAIVTDLRIPNSAYKDSCLYIQNAIENDTEFLVCCHANEDNTVKLVAQKVICLDGSANALTAALIRYRKLKKLLEEGKDITIAQIEEELANGTAISDETINAALDKALDFIFRCTESKATEDRCDTDGDALALRATLESTVLLKNNDALLPLSNDKKVAVIDCFSKNKPAGEELGARCAAELTSNGFGNVEWIKGCDETMCNDDQISDILTMAKNADVTLLLLGSGYDAEKRIHKTEKLTLPPEQMYLTNQISANAKRVVAVVLSEHAPDMEFAYSFDSLLLTPLEIKHSAKAIVQIITGESDAGGRLAYTLYSGSEISLKKGCAYRQSYGMKAGTFIGYRYYDTADMCVGYPFGYGLSYASFVYSDLSVSADEVSFTIQNRGSVRGCEVAQVYAGIKNSAVLRPKKELCGFAKIELEPMEKKRISVKTELPRIFANGELVREKGTYAVYVGASVSDIRLCGECEAGDAVLAPDGEKISDYLQTGTNILNDKYVLEADYCFMKKSVKNIIAGVVAIALSIALAVFNITTHVNSMVLGIIAGILALSAVLFFIVDIAEKSKLRSAQIKEIAKANGELFENAEQIPVFSAEKMFEDRFDESKEEHKQKEELFDISENFATQENVKEDFHILDAVREFNKFAYERGYKMGNGVTENLFASLSVSRLLILNGLKGKEFNSFMLLLSEYFGTSVCVDNSASEEKKEEQNTQSVFFEYDHEGYHVQKNICKALGNAVNVSSAIHLSAIDEINNDNINEWISPLMRYVKSTKKRNEISINDGTGKILRYNIARNLWIILRLADRQTVETLPIEIVKSAAVVNISFTKCQTAEEYMPEHGFTSNQVEYMLTKDSGTVDVSEDFWKKLDKFEKYAATYSEYRIGNKLWLEMEKHLGMLLACGMEMNDAADAAIAARVLPSVTVALKDKLEKEDKTVYQSMEFIFGADNLSFSKTYMESLDVKELPVESEQTEKAVTDEIAEAAQDISENKTSDTEGVEEAVTEETAEAAQDISENKTSDTEGTEEAVTEETADPAQETQEPIFENTAEEEKAE